MRDNRAHTVAVFFVTFLIMLPLPVMPGKLSLEPIWSAYGTLYDSIREQATGTFFAHSIAIIMAHWSLSFAVALIITKYIHKRIN